MNFEWDEAKSETCFKERGFDFAYAAQAFFDQDRLQLLGRIDSRIISARKANTREVKEYDNDTTEN